MNVEDKKYTVYIHTNKINNKCYIGITCKKLEERWRTNGSGYFKKIKMVNLISQRLQTQLKNTVGTILNILFGQKI